MAGSHSINGTFAYWACWNSRTLANSAGFLHSGSQYIICTGQCLSGLTLVPRWSSHKCFQSHSQMHASRSCLVYTLWLTYFFTRVMYSILTENITQIYTGSRALSLTWTSVALYVARVAVAGDARVIIIQGESYWTIQIELEVQFIMVYHLQQV